MFGLIIDAQYFVVMVELKIVLNIGLQKRENGRHGHGGIDGL